MEQLPAERYDLRILQSLRRIIRAVDLHSKRLEQNLKLTGPQLVCLLEIEAREPITAAQLAKLVYLSPSTLVGILDRLENKALIVRNRSARDRRQVKVTLSEQGREFCSKAPSP